MKIDMHLHSVYSDGTLLPAELINILNKRGVKAASLTDHDTTAGIEEMRQACIPEGIQWVPGVEVSAFEDCEVHILGYNFDLSPDSPIMKCLEETTSARNVRIGKIIEKLRGLGLEISLEEVDKYAYKSRNRSHLARVLIDKGYVKSREEAMAKYLGVRGAAWVDFFSLPPGEVVKKIRDSGGLAVLAHPGRLNLKPAQIEPLVVKLVKAGLSGIESYYATHNITAVQFFCTIAGRYKLFNSYGSDYHSGTDHYSAQGGFHETEAEQSTLEAFGIKTFEKRGQG